MLSLHCAVSAGGAGAGAFPPIGIRTFAIFVVGPTSTFTIPRGAACRAKSLNFATDAFYMPALNFAGTDSVMLEYVRAPVLPEDKRARL